jgi:hypothetical protein
MWFRGGSVFRWVNEQRFVTSHFTYAPATGTEIARAASTFNYKRSNILWRIYHALNLGAMVPNGIRVCSDILSCCDYFSALGPVFFFWKKKNWYIIVKNEYIIFIILYSIYVCNVTTFMCRLSWNLWASTSWNPQGLSRPVMGSLYLFLICLYVFMLLYNFVNFVFLL